MLYTWILWYIRVTKTDDFNRTTYTYNSKYLKKMCLTNYNIIIIIIIIIHYSQ